MPSALSSNTSKRSQSVNWARYTDFRSRHSKKDLSKLCGSLKRNQLKEVFSTPDEAGLYPIHWAAINNRSDLIEFLVDNGSPIRTRCSNKLFSDGTALHLAAMNGSIEAASSLLAKCEQLEKNQTKPKTLDGQQASERREEQGKSEVANWLDERDSEGQTALMRSAAPRSKRLDTVRDLLRKNLWSLSGRPAEMALFLINAGADWRQTDSKYGMNLMHWAIANDYDDIVNMLLIIDKQLLDVKARLAPAIEERRGRMKRKQAPEPLDDELAKNGGFETVRLSRDTNSTDSGSASNQTNDTGASISSQEPLLETTKRKELDEMLATEGLSPLQLAILYGRVGVINLLWLLTNNVKTDARVATNQPGQQRGVSIRLSRQKELRDILIRAYWANKTELGRLIRSGLLRFALAVDISILVLLWLPIYIESDIVVGRNSIVCDVKGGALIVSCCLSLALTCRVMLKNPGFLRRSSIQYLSELNFLVGKKKQTHQQASEDPNTTTNAIDRKRDEAAKSTSKEPADQQRSTNSKQVQIVLPLASTSNNKQAELKIEERVRLLCHKCRCIRRPRSRHCNSCNHCVQEFDHHCIYLGCCIGRENRFDFLLMMIMVSLTAIYGTALYSIVLDRHQSGQFWHFIGLIWIFKYVIIGTLSSFFILRRACLGVTMFEQIRSNRIRRIFGRDGPPEDISKSHKVYSTNKGSFWRYAPDRFMTGELPLKKLLSNFRDFTSYASFGDYFLALACSDTALARSLTSSDSKVDLYKFV